MSDWITTHNNTYINLENVNEILVLSTAKNRVYSVTAYFNMPADESGSVATIACFNTEEEGHEFVRNLIYNRKKI